MNSQSLTKVSLFSIFSPKDENSKGSIGEVSGQNPESSAFSNLFAMLFSAKDKGERAAGMVNDKSKIEFQEIEENVKANRDIKFNVDGDFYKVDGNANLKYTTGNESLTNNPSKVRDKINKQDKNIYADNPVNSNSETKMDILNVPWDKKPNADMKQLKASSDDSSLNGNSFAGFAQIVDMQDSPLNLNTTLARTFFEEVSINKTENRHFNVKNNGVKKINPGHLVNKGNTNNIERSDKELGSELSTKNIVEGLTKENLKLGVTETQQRAGHTVSEKGNKSDEQSDAVKDVKAVSESITGKSYDRISVEIKSKDDNGLLHARMRNPVPENIGQHKDNYKSDNEVNAAGKESREDKPGNGRVSFVSESGNVVDDTKTKQVGHSYVTKQDNKLSEGVPADNIGKEDIPLKTEINERVTSSQKRENSLKQGVRIDENVSGNSRILKTHSTASEVLEIKNTEKAPFTERPLVIQTAHAIVNMNSSGETKLTVVLSPPSMGKMKIELTSDKDGVDAKLIVDIKEVKEIIDSAVSDMKDVISKSGVHLRDIVVELAPNQHNNKDFGDGLHRNKNSEAFDHGRNSSNEKREDSPSLQEDMEKDTARYFGYNSMEIIA